MRHNIETFMQVCRAQDVQLDENFADELHEPPYVRFLYTPSDMLWGVAQAGKQLRERTGVELASATLDPKSADVRGDFAAKTLVGIINDSVVEETSSRSQLDFDGNHDVELPTCKLAERNFGNTFISLAGEYPDREKGSQIIMDGDVPVLLRKNYGEKTSLTLIDIAVEGVNYPAGSIVRAELAEDDDLDEWRADIPSNGVSVGSIGDVTSVGFIRLSAFALPPKERYVFGESLAALDDRCEKLLQKARPKDLNRIVRGALNNHRQFVDNAEEQNNSVISVDQERQMV